MVTLGTMITVVVMVAAVGGELSGGTEYHNCSVNELDVVLPGGDCCS